MKGSGRPRKVQLKAEDRRLKAEERRRLVGPGRGSSCIRPAATVDFRARWRCVLLLKDHYFVRG